MRYSLNAAKYDEAKDKDNNDCCCQFGDANATDKGIYDFATAKRKFRGIADCVLLNCW